MLLRLTRLCASVIVLLVLFSPFEFSLAAVPETPSFEPAGKAESAAVSQRRRRRRRRPRGQQKPTPERIKEIQSALIRVKYLKGKPTGVWDAGTRQAMKRFQKDNGFRATGKPEAISLFKLGLGSKTAGVGAPLPRQESAGEASPQGAGGRNR